MEIKDFRKYLLKELKEYREKIYKNFETCGDDKEKIFRIVGSLDAIDHITNFFVK